MTVKQNIPALRFPEFEGEWKSNNIGSIGELEGGGTPQTKNSTFWDGNIPWISSSDVKDDDIFNLNVTRFITDEAIAASATKRIPKNSILIVTRVGVGKVAYSVVEICTSQDFQSLTPKRDNPKFLAYQIQLKAKKFLEFNQGTSIKGITKADLSQIEINTPTLPEQQKIASFLSAVDKKIKQLTRKKALLEKYKQGVMQQIFSREIRFRPALSDLPRAESRGVEGPENGEEYPEWEWKTLGDLCEPPQYGMNASAIAFDGLNKYIRITDIDENSRKYKPNPVTSPEGLMDEKYRLKGGDLLFARTGASVGKSYIYKASDGNLFFAGFLIKFHVKKALPNFVFMSTLLDSYPEWVKKMSMRSGQPGINAEEYKTLPIHLPCREEQQKIASFLSELDEKIGQVGQQLEKAKEWKKGLLQGMFV